MMTAHNQGHQLTNAAVFVAGDHRIFFPALVALTSIEHHNPGKFDLYMCFSGKDLTAPMAETLRRYSVSFIPMEEIEGFEDAVSLPVMDEGAWPVEVFINWALPEYLGSRGYEYSIKVDYDTLCIAPFDTPNTYLPKSGSIIRALRLLGGSTYVPKEAARRVNAELGIDCSHKYPMNAGFVTFDNRICIERGFFRRFVDLYRVLSESAEAIKLLEQVVAAILAHRLGGYRRLDRRYNQRIWHVREVDDFTTDIVIIHYSTNFKPWLPFTMENAHELARRGRGALPFYRNMWIEFASSIDGYSSFCSEKPYNSREFLALALAVVGTMASMIKDLKKASVQDFT